MALNVIDEKGDLTITVIEYDEDTKNGDGQNPVRKSMDFLVSREVLAKSSQYFTVLLLSNNYKEAKKECVTLHDDRVATMAIWFCVLHEVNPSYDVNLDEMWYLAAAGNKYQLQINKLYDWFAKWYQSQPIDRWYLYGGEKSRPDGVPEIRSLLYPCWIIDHPKGFLRITKHLAYNFVGHVTERNPTKFHDLHLPSRVIQQLNAAKGRLRTVVHNGLFEPNERLLKALCKCKKETLFDYEKELYKIDVWPLERIAQYTPMTKILGRLDSFDFDPQKSACIFCCHDYKKSVKLTRARTKDYFHGLCLDCMDKSRSKKGDEDADYWQHNSLKEDDVVRGCRHTHGQPTWYFSFMGRQEVKDQYRREKRMMRYEGDSD